VYIDVAGGRPYSAAELEAAAKKQRKAEKRATKTAKAARRAEVEKTAWRAVAFDALETVALGESNPDDARARVSAAEVILAQTS
jgi:hypothetical protein